MHVGTQLFSTSDSDLEYLARHGVFNKNEAFITFHREYGWDVEESATKKEKCAGAYRKHPARSRRYPSTAPGTSRRPRIPSRDSTNH